MRVIGSLHTLPASYFAGIKDGPASADAVSSREDQDSEQASIEHQDRCSIDLLLAPHYRGYVVSYFDTFSACRQLPESQEKADQPDQPDTLPDPICNTCSSQPRFATRLIHSLHAHAISKAPAAVVQKHTNASIFYSIFLLQPLLVWSLEALLNKESTSNQTGIVTISSASSMGTHLSMKTPLRPL